MGPTLLFFSAGKVVGRNSSPFTIRPNDAVKFLNLVATAKEMAGQDVIKANSYLWG
jgi:hypothetical protein